MSETALEQRPEIGGTDGFRGIATQETGPGRMNPDTIAALTYSLVAQQREAGEGNVCVIGRDTRESGPLLQQAAVAGALAAKAEVVLVGVAPTPTIQWLAKEFGAASAIALTASHNKARYNGWKGMLGAYKPMGDEVKGISDRYWATVNSGLSIPLEAANNVQESVGLIEHYKQAVIKDILAAFPDAGERPLEGKVFVADAANGSAMNVMPDILEKLGATVEKFACDGSKPINENSGAASLDGVKEFASQRLQKLTEKPDSTIEMLIVDGDADRFIGLGARMINGEVAFREMEGNRVLELLAQGQPGMVGTDYTNDASVHRLEKLGIGFQFCENGDANVTGALLELQKQGLNWTRGSEFTGHHVNLEWLPSGDGVRTAAWLAVYAATNQTNLFDLAESMPLWPQSMVEVELPGLSDKELKMIVKNEQVATQIESTRQALNGTGRPHVRASGTEPVIRVWAVGQEEKTIKRHTAEIAKVIRQSQVRMSRAGIIRTTTELD